MLRSLVRPAVLLSALVLLGGCLLEGTIDAKGAGTMTITYRLTSEAQLESSKKRMESPQVKLVSAKVDKDKRATFEIKFDSITHLSTTQFFQNVTFTLADGEAGTRVFTAKFVNKNPSKLPDEMVAYFGNEVRMTLHLPGEVVKSNATSTKDNTVTWTYPLNEFTTMKELSVDAVFKPGAAGAAKSEGDKGTPAPPTKPPGN